MPAVVLLTKREAEVLLHRLTLHDCIAEACTDHDPACDPAPRFTYAELEASAVRLERELAEHGTLTIISPPFGYSIICHPNNCPDDP